MQIVFITGYSDYIADGYEVEALHYLMKPVDEDKLFAVLDRAAEKLRRNEKVLTRELAGELVRLPVYQIRCAEVQGNYVTIHARADYTVKMTLSELESQLDENLFPAGAVGAGEPGQRGPGDPHGGDPGRRQHPAAAPGRL